MIAGLAVAALLAGQAAPDLQRYEYRQRLMGVDFNLALYAPSEAVANAAAKAAFARVQRLNRILSDYEPESELMTLCANSGPGKPVKVSPELLFVLSRAQQLSKQTGGAFDVTVGHLTRLWRNARRQRRAPKPKDIAQAKRRTGFQFVRIDSKKQTVELRKVGMRLDLGGIAKGYAGDEALKILRTHGVTRAMIDASGDVVVGDAPPGKRGWMIAIAPLSTNDRVKPRTVLLKNAAVATSGDAYQFVEFHGQR
ncbi:MAG: FAD:protein FMN transferase, partial [Planctomycetaceae bacterium]